MIEVVAAEGEGNNSALVKAYKRAEMVAAVAAAVGSEIVIGMRAYMSRAAGVVVSSTAQSEGEMLGFRGDPWLQRTHLDRGWMSMV